MTFMRGHVVDAPGIKDPPQYQAPVERVDGGAVHPTNYGTITTLPVTFRSAMSFKACAVSASA